MSTEIDLDDFHYGWSISSHGGRIGWIQWRNKVNLDGVPDWVTKACRGGFGVTTWNQPRTPEEKAAFQEYIRLEQELFGCEYQG